MGHRRRWVGTGLVVAAATFNMILAFVNAHGLKIDKRIVVVAEAAICMCAALAVYRALSLRASVFAAVFAAYICAVWALSDAIDTQLIASVFIIPFVFFWCGIAYAEPQEADRLVYFLILLVLIVALWEWFSVDQFVSTFDISSYYIDKGKFASKQLWNHTGYAINGFRSAAEGGRVLFPALGLHRVSSIFLEPTSIGYFATTTFAWLLVRFRNAPGRNLLFMALILVLVVMGDSRTAAIACIFLIIARVLPPLPRIGVWLLPFLTLAAIIGIAVVHPGQEVDQTVTGRLVGSGRLMLAFTGHEWLGIGDALQRSKVDNLDSGYAYLIYTIGIVGMVLLWTAYSFSEDRTFDGARYRTMLAIYLSLSLAVTEGIFSIKTAALAWFLLGAAQNQRDRYRIAEGAATDVSHRSRPIRKPVAALPQARASHPAAAPGHPSNRQRVPRIG